MPNRSTRDEMQGLNPDGTRQVSAPSRSAFDPAPTAAKAGPVASTPPPASTPTPTPVDNSTSDLSALGAVQKLQARKGQINQAIDDAS